MTKYYCDRCGVECGDLNTIKIPTKRTSFGFETEPMEVCASCQKEYDRIIDALIDIRFLMFEKFFELKGGM